MHVLSTKILTAKQKEIGNRPDISLTDYSAIRVTERDFLFPEKMYSVIFTSQHTVRIILEKIKGERVNKKDIQAFCVGPKTANLLKKNDISVAHYTNYASELAEYLVSDHATEHFDFFCGNLRRDTLPKVLKKHGVSFTETQVYRTELTPKVFTKQFDMVLFFSPSGIQSFTKANVLSKNTKVICIGTTTAEEAKKYTDNIKIADTTTVESVLQKMIAELKE